MNMTIDLTNLTGMEKASILLMALGTNLSAEVFKHLSEPEIEKISAQIIKMRDVDPAIISAVVTEFEMMCSSPTDTFLTGKNFAAQALEQAMGKEKATVMLDRAGSGDYAQPFESLLDWDPGKLAQLLSTEHPQVIALVLANIPSEKAASTLCKLDEVLQSEVAHRICIMGEIEPDVLKSVEEALQARLETGGVKSITADGPKVLVDILNNAERSTEKLVLDSLMSEDPTVGDKVRKMMFVYEDLTKLSNRTIQLVLREVDQEDLRMALKGSDEQIQNLVFKNMSERAADMLREDLELVGSVRQKDVEASQQKIVSVVRRLLATGEATIEEATEEASSTEAEMEWPADMMEMLAEEGNVEQSDQIEKAA